MGVAISTLVQEVPARNFYLIRDRVQGKKRSKQRGIELSRIFPFHQNFMAGAKCADVVVANVSSERFELAAKILFGFLPVAEGALAAWYRMPREFGSALLEPAELNVFERRGLSRHSQLIGVCRESPWRYPVGSSRSLRPMSRSCSGGII